MPRKSNISQITSTGDEGTPSKEKEGISVEDLSLPRTMVQRLAKGVLPPNTIIQKDAITAMSKGATVFVNYLSAHANANTRLSSKKTITPADVLAALREIEFEDFLPRLEKELARYSEVQTDKRNTYRKKAKEEKLSGGGVGGGGKGIVGDGEGPARKRVRRRTEGGGVGVGVVNGTGTGEEGGEETVDDEEEEEGEGEGEQEQEQDGGEEVDVDVEAEAEDEGGDDGEVDAQLEQELDDEALDNGEDSD